MDEWVGRMDERMDGWVDGGKVGSGWLLLPSFVMMPWLAYAAGIQRFVMPLLHYLAADAASCAKIHYLSGGRISPTRQAGIPKGMHFITETLVRYVNS
jgi:hypothetical protein